MESVYDPYDMFFGDGQKSPNSDGLLFPNEIMLSDFNTDSSPSISPVSNTIDNTGSNIQYFVSSLSNNCSINLENEFDPAIFEKLLNELLSSDPTTLQEQSINLSFSTLESEPPTREMGTDPMEPAPTTLPLIIKTNNINQFTNNPIYLIQTVNKTPTETVSNEYYNLQFESSTTTDYPMEEVSPLTPSTLSESPDDSGSHSPDYSQDNAYSKLLTNFDVKLFFSY